MNIIPSSRKRDETVDLTSSNRIQGILYPYVGKVNFTEGGEFVDDAIRTKDQPVAEKNMNENMYAVKIGSY